MADAEEPPVPAHVACPAGLLSASPVWWRFAGSILEGMTEAYEKRINTVTAGAQAEEPSRRPYAREWKRHEPSAGCRTTRAEESTSTGPEPIEPSCRLRDTAGSASGCFSRAFLNHGHRSVG